MALQSITLTSSEGKLCFHSEGEDRPIAEIRQPGAFAFMGGSEDQSLRYAAVERDSSDPGVLQGRVIVEHPLGAVLLEDTWRRSGPTKWNVTRQLSTTSTETIGVRVALHLEPISATAFSSYRTFAPAVLFDLNDLDGDGLEDFLDTDVLHFRDDRLTARAMIAHDPNRSLTLVLARESRPEFDTIPERPSQELAFLQKTDIGSLGIQPSDQGGMDIVGTYPFMEGERSHALLADSRPGWGAYWPLTSEQPAEVTFSVEAIEAADVHDGLWSAWKSRLAALAPVPVQLETGLDELARLRADALAEYFFSEPGTEPRAAGFVLNCHPADGQQVSNVIQFGFTGQHTLNGYNFLRLHGSGGPADYRRMGLETIDFFARTVGGSDTGLSWGLYNTDLRRYGTWWTGILLPLAYAEPGDDLERLMGPLYDHLREVIEALAQTDGMYLRTAAEDYDALLQAYAYEFERGIEHEDWLSAARNFAHFLIRAQEEDGSWFRAYSLAGAPLRHPERWFGETSVTQKSSTACVVPFLVRYSRLTGESGALEAAIRAGRFVRELYIDGMKFNGGVLDSPYTRTQLVDSESIMFAFRAMMILHEADGAPEYLGSAVRAARILATWIWLWDIPLPPDSTLAQWGFRSTGWQGCDTPGAGYVHPFALVFVAELVQIALQVGDPDLLEIAALLQAGCNENVATPEKSWGYARPGLQEEGLHLSWWFGDDPMNVDTEFGGRLKGEGNKTCFPWVNAVALYGHLEMLERFSVSDVNDVPKAGSRRVGEVL